MEENNKNLTPETEEVPHEKTVRLMSPTRMVVRRFFRSKLSIVGLIMVVTTNYIVGKIDPDSQLF